MQSGPFLSVLVVVGMQGLGHQRKEKSGTLSVEEHFSISKYSFELPENSMGWLVNHCI